MTKAWLLSAALRDVEAAYGWYEIQRAGLGEEFIGVVDAAIGHIVEFPRAAAVSHRDSRRYLVERFPFCLYYRIEGQGVIVIALLHAAMDLEHHLDRLGD